MTALYFDARIDSAKLQSDIARINSQISKISDNMAKEGNEIDAITKRIGTALAGAFAVFSAGQFIKDVARVRGEFQQLEVAFETMLGNKEKADQLMQQVVEFAGNTPFQLKDVATGAKQLLAFGVEADNVLPTLKSMGDVSAGLSVPIERLILNYGQVRTQLKLTGKELRDFQTAGVPIVAELAKNLGVMDTDIADMVSASKIGFDDVEKAFRTMTSEGGRFSDLMDKQAKTITGLASNFADAWDKMLNSIGKQNEGVIADSIKAATELVNNYEEVLKVLKVLAITYGTYKAVVIAAGIAQKTAATYGVFDVATKKLQISATLKAATAQTALNTAMKANPIGLIIGAIGALVSILTVYGIKSNEAAGVSAKFTQNLGEEKKAIGQAFDAIKKAKDGTDERAKAIAIVNEKYKEYLPNLLTEASNLKEVEKAQNLVTTAVARTLAFKAQEEQLGDLKERTTGAWSDFYNAIDKSVKGLTSEKQGEIKAMMEEYARGVKDWSGMSTIASEFEKLAGKKLGAFAYNDLDSAFKAVNKSEKEVIDTTKDLKAEYDSYLKALGIGESVPEPALLKTVNERIVETNNLLAAAKVRLTELMASGSTATDKDLIDQNAQIKEYEEKLVLLTGVSKQVTQSLLKEEKERFEGEVDFAEQEIELRRNVEASRLAIMQEGTERQKREAEVAYQNELDLIKKQEQEYLKAYNAKTGLKPTDSGYVTELPIEAFEKFDTLRINAEIDKNQKIKLINESSAKAIKAIWDDVNDVYLTDTQRTIKQINQHYDSLVEEAKKIDPTADISKINAARGQATTEAVINSQIGILEFEEEIAMQRAEISTQGFNREYEIEKKKINNAKDFAAKRIKLLKDSGKKETDLEVQAQQLIIDGANKNLEDLQIKNVLNYAEQISQVFGEIGASIGAMNGELGEAMSTLSTIVGGFANGGLIGGLSAFVSELIKGIASTKGMTDEEIKTDNLEEINKSISRTNELLDFQLNLLADLDGSDWFTSALKSLKVLNGELASTKKKLSEITVYSKERGKPKIDTSKWTQEQWIKAINSKGAFSFDGLEEGAQNYLDQWIKIDNEIKNIEKEQKDRLLGFNQDEIATGIADGIISGLKLAENGLGGFAESFGKLMETYGKKALETFINEKYLSNFYDQAYALANDADGLSDTDLTNLEGLYAIAAKGGEEFYSKISKLFSYGDLASKADSAQEGIKGSFASLTEETGGMIAGQFFAFRELQQKNYDTALMQLDSINQTVGHLAEIASNTRYNRHLESIALNIENMNKKIQSDL